MKHLRLCGALVAAAAAFAIMAVDPATMAGQDKAAKAGKTGGKAKGPVAYQKPVKGEIPRTGDGQPDLNGVWMRPYTSDMTKGGGNASASTLNFTDWGKGKWEAYNAAEGDYAGACLPFGLIRSINAPHPMQIVQSKTFVAFLHEQNTWFTKVPTDGRPFPSDADMDPTWFGTSRGHWDGDTLIIDSKGFNGKTRLDTIGHPHSEKMSVRETWTLMNPTQVYYTIEINDPRTYKDPIKSERTFTRDPKGEVMEYSCEENNKSLFEGRIKPPNFEEWLK
ncbi:MAG: hypothetical protein ABI811_17365 [Acidobacteriota bacterium]